METTITPELAIEGIARKQADLQVSDRILLHISGSDGVKEALTKYKQTIATETLTTSWLHKADDDCFTAKGSADDQRWEIALKRA